MSAPDQDTGAAGISKSAGIAADYRAGVKVAEIRRKHRVSSEAVRSVLIAHGIQSRGYGFHPLDTDRLEMIAADLRTDMRIDDIRAKHKCGSEEIARAKRIYKIQRPRRIERPKPQPNEDPRLQAIFADYQAGMKIGDLRVKHRCGTDIVMRAVRALGEPRTTTAELEESIRQMARAGDSISTIKQKLRVGFRRVHRVCAEAGIELVQWWGGKKCEPRREGKSRKIVPRTMVYEAPPAEPTREDYARLCDKEFSTPPYLREAPAMLARIEANEALERARLREIERRNEARRARKVMA